MSWSSWSSLIGQYALLAGVQYTPMSSMRTVWPISTITQYYADTALHYAIALFILQTLTGLMSLFLPPFITSMIAYIEIPVWVAMCYNTSYWSTLVSIISGLLTSLSPALIFVEAFLALLCIQGCGQYVSFHASDDRFKIFSVVSVLLAVGYTYVQWTIAIPHFFAAIQSASLFSSCMTFLAIAVAYRMFVQHEWIDASLMWLYTLFQLSNPSVITLWTVRAVVFILGWYFICSLRGDPFFSSFSNDESSYDQDSSINDIILKAFWRPAVTLFITFASLQMQQTIVEQGEIEWWRWITRCRKSDIVSLIWYTATTNLWSSLSKDGLLLDTERIYTQVTQEIVDRYGKKYTWELKSRMMGLREDAACQLLVDALELPISAEEYRVERNRKQNELFATASLMPGVDRLVRHLKAHRVPIAVATSSSRPAFDVKTSQNRALFDLFDVIVTGDEPAIRQGKPAPDIFLEAARRLNAEVTEACLVFEDAISGVQAALNANMHVCWVPDPNLVHDGSIKAHQTLTSLEYFDPEHWGLPSFQ